MKTFTHNGGIWTRPDIPSATPQPWTCAGCSKEIDSQVEQYRLQTGEEKIRFVPASRYWDGYQVGVEFCSPECSFHYTQTK